MHSKSLASFVATSGIVVLAACSDSTSADQKTLTVSFATHAAAAAVTGDVTVGDGTNTIVITKAQVVVRKLELKQSGETTCRGDDGEDDEQGDDVQAGEQESVEDCEEVKAGPLLVDLPLTAGSTTELTGSIPAGSYRELELKIHKPTDTPADQAFVAANPEFADASIRVEGTFNGTPFVYTSKLTGKIELEFDPPLALDDNNRNVTIRVDVGSWFKNGVTVLDPATALPGQPNELLVNGNIRRSLHAFEDNDHDGHDDDGIDDDDDH